MKIHLGCSDVKIPGFINIDQEYKHHIDYIADVSKLVMFEDNTISLIYTSHVLEHFGRHDIERVLTEWYRVLKPGGTLRISVPDFEAIVRAYQKGYEMEDLMGLLYGGQDKKLNYHYVCFNFKYLKQLLEKVGFVDIKKYDWRKTIHKDYDDYSQAYLPHMNKEDGLLMSLNVEAKKTIKK